MDEFLIFAGLVLILLVPLFIVVFMFIFKKTINFPVSIIMTLNAAVTAILSFLTAKIGLMHLFWTAPMVMFFLIGSIFYFRKLVSLPLKVLTDDINEVANGNLKIVIDNKLLSQEDEIGEISRMLNTMIINLRRSAKIFELISQGLIYGASNASSAIVNKGDLDNSVEKMISKLTSIIQEINQSSDAIFDGSAEISASSESVAQAANQQAASIEEISSSMEEMVSVINQNAENAEQTVQFAKKSSQDIRLVKDALDYTLKSVKLIADKIDIINEIAEKTDLLAINASIEAARAGEYGNGFAVVAREIRKLAEKTQSASEIITELAINTVNEASKSGELLGGVIPDILATRQLVEEISVSCAEQLTGSTQINIAITQLNQITQINAASAEELSGSSGLFAKQADVLKNSISFFRLNKRNEGLLRKEIMHKIEEMSRMLNESFETEHASISTIGSVNSNESPLDKGFIVKLEQEGTKDFEPF